MLKIKIEELQKGMTILKCDKEWLTLPIFGKPLDDDNYIEIMKNYGVKHVFVKNDKVVQEMLNTTNSKNDKQRSNEYFNITLSDFLFYKDIYNDLMNFVKEMFHGFETKESLDETLLLRSCYTIKSFASKAPTFAFNIFDESDDSNYLFKHSLNVAILSSSLARAMGHNDEKVQAITIGSLLHDIGMTKIPKEIYDKKGKLTKSEYFEIKKHPIYGYKLAQKVKNIDLISLSVILEHHERSDGSGYPRRLKEDQISVFSKITAIADAYDALVSPRPYKEGISHKEAFSVIFSWSGEHFNQTLVNFFLHMLKPYPVGTVVKLDTGEYGVVFENNPNDVNTPKVLLVDPKDSSNVILYDLLSYNIVSKKPYKKIEAVVSPYAAEIRPAEIIEHFLRSK